MLANALDPQGSHQHPLVVPCIRPKALLRVAHPLHTRNWPSLKRCLWHLQGASATCAATQKLLLHVGE